MYKLIKFAKKKTISSIHVLKNNKKVFWFRRVRNLLKANLDKLARVSMDKTHLRVGAARHDEWLIEGQLKKTG